MMDMEPQKPKRRRSGTQRKRMTPDERREAMIRRDEAVRQKMATYSQFREALMLITGLPRAADMAGLTRLYDRSGYVKQRIASIAQWMKDFENAWNSPSDDDQT